MKKSAIHCLYLISAIIFLLNLCACSTGTNSVPEVSESESTEDVAAFVSDFSPGEENHVGNIWSNSTLCSQGNYVYHYNGATECFEKWTKGSSAEQAVTISMQPNVSGHIEVVGDYIYFCQKSDEVIGKDTLYNIMKIRTDGNELTTVETGCLNCQFRIVGDMLFYLSLYHKQTDASTEEYYISTEQASLTSDWLISWPVTDNMGVPVSSNYYGTHTNRLLCNYLRRSADAGIYI